ncbi:MAG: dinitrogenase iron-molybdenum cofactor biosynthesis protein [Candidatus Aenigmatarchaeota archaeon]|nr:MAG: dinitrogenase iron-molybdenum cofactor biosynthesis protein [Candidatus Aenigmarchaeota archaeon ex4484_14]RLI96861.1 MAG: dinitrogenase iron-molybdenum cofactor biosynthesis protein [Candidatus Aenigmarchaeota archaeon]
MRIAIPINEDKGLNSDVAYHFGRCQSYLVLDENGKVVETLDNESAHMGGTGLPPEFLKKHDIDILLCQGIGPNAVELCQRLGIAVYTSQAKTVKEIFDLWKSGKLEKATREDSCNEHKA